MPKGRDDRGWMARIVSEAFTVFDGFEVVHLGGSFVSLRIDAGPDAACALMQRL